MSVCSWLGREDLATCQIAGKLVCEIIRKVTFCFVLVSPPGRLEHAQQMAGHESPRTTKLYDRTKDEITLSAVERIRL
jgi:hypothetical protein